jgi:hypothetical protein
LRKEPIRRYASAAAFAEDIERFQKKLPVAARGDGSAYLVSKTVWRHRMRIAALILIGISFIGAGAAGWQALSYRSELEAIRGELSLVKSHETQYRTLPAAEAHALMQRDLNHLSNEFETRTPAILKSKLAPQGMTRQLVQQSLTYFADTQSSTGQDPGTVAALGRAYLAVARTQWSSDHASLNDPADAAQTCISALKALTSTDDLSKSPEVLQALGQIKASLEANPATRQQDMQGSQ